MKVKIRWTEEVQYESVIEIDEDELKEYAGVDKPDASAIKDFILAGDESDWFEQVDTSQDFQAVEARSIESASVAA